MRDFVGDEEEITINFPKFIFIKKKQALWKLLDQWL
jgi:hypothetical protein